MEKSPSFKAFLPTIVILNLIGWVGLAVLMTSIRPTPWPRWLFFVLVVVAFSGAALPATVYLNHRFPSKPPATAQVMVRQALWVGIFVATLVWLNVGGVLDFGLAMIFFTGFAAIEVFLRIWERSRWRRP